MRTLLLGRFDCASLFAGLAIDEVTFLGEVVVDVGVDRGELADLRWRGMRRALNW